MRIKLKIIILLFLLLVILLLVYKNIIIKSSSFEVFYTQPKPYNSIVFYHFQVNGDITSSRILVDHIIKNTQHLNIDYYYNAHRCLPSQLLDLGINDDKFNKMILPEGSEDKKIFLDNNILYINVWVGFYPNICVWCMKGIIEGFNTLINEYNILTNSIMDFIDLSKNYLNYNYDYYNCDFLKDFITDKKNKYDKIIIFYNGKVNTHIQLNTIDHNLYINKIGEYNNYFIITFFKTDIVKDNIISIEEIYNQYNRVSLNYGIEMSYMSIYVDKVITLASGVFLPCTHEKNKNIDNKFLMIHNENVGGYICHFENNYTCFRKLGWYVKNIYYKNDDIEALSNGIIDFINN